MSLPLTRRIARAALLIAAGAAPVVGAAGSASAAELPATPNLGGVTALDGAGLGSAVDGAAQNVTRLAGETGSKAVKKSVPTADKAVKKSVKKSVPTTGKAVRSGTKATPAAQKAAGGVAGSTGKLLGDTANAATEGGLPTGAVGGGLATDQLPVKGLPLG
ncbi:ATP-binding protein [Streptomyces sp. NPDC021622]|uniref:ATP-binding protein n=1 Tax=Streptomyces sp. NPDC021622 TaxID=3155013 RepID=UPI0033DF486A